MSLVDELAQTISHLGDAGPTRQQSEDHLNVLLLRSPSNFCPALIAVGATGADPLVRHQAFILLRRLAFKTLPGAELDPLARIVWDLIEDNSKSMVQQGLLQALAASGEKQAKERSSICDCIASVQKAGFERGGTWPELSATLSTLFSSPSLTLRESTFRIYAEIPALLESEAIPVVIQGLAQGLKDTSPGVRLAALSASTSIICNADIKKVGSYSTLVPLMLELLPQFSGERAESRLTQALFSLIDLASTPKLPARLLKPHLASLLAFCLSLIAPSPYRTSPNYSAQAWDETVRAPALEVLLSLVETAPNMIKSHSGFVEQLVACLLNIMGEREDDPEWAESEDLVDDENDSLAVVGEGGIDRMSRSLGDVVFAPTLQYVNQNLIASSVWQHRYAALSSIASICEGCIDLMTQQLASIVGVLIRSTSDPHPQVIYAAIYAIGQLCTDLEGVLQESHGREILQALVATTSSHEPRLQAYASACLVNFFQNTDSENILDILPSVFAALVRLLDQGRYFVKENAIEGLTLLAGSMQDGFSSLYGSIMPQLLHLIETGGNDEALKPLRAKAIDCAATIADAVDSSLFAPDATRLLSAMHKIQLEITSDDDGMTLRYLLRAYSQLAATVGSSIFAPYVSNVLPYLVEAAQSKPETLTGDAADEVDEEWESVEVDEGGGRMAIRTSALEDKVEAVENLVVLTQALGTSLDAATLEALVDVALPLLKFYFHIGVREAASALVAVAIQGLAMASVTTEHLKSILNRAVHVLIDCIASDTDAEILTTFLVALNSSVASLPRCLSATEKENFLKAVETQVVLLRTREAARNETTADEDDVLEWEDDSDVDAQVYTLLNKSLACLMKDDPTTFPLGPVVPFLNLVDSGSATEKTFALNLCHDLLEKLPTLAAPAVQTHFPRVLASVLDPNVEVRTYAAKIIGAAAEKCTTSSFDFALASVEPLLASIGPIDMDDNEVLTGRDSSIGALSRIIRAYREEARFPLESILPRWVAALPVLVDASEFESTCSLLMELIARSHSSVSPTTSVSQHMTKVLVSLVQSDIMPYHLTQAIAETLKQHLTAGGNTVVWATLPPEVQEILSALP